MARSSVSVVLKIAFVILEGRIDRRGYKLVLEHVHSQTPLLELWDVAG